MHVNLLPIAVLRRLTLRRQVSRWFVVLLLTSLICGWFVANQYRALAKVRQAQAVTASRSRELHAAKADTERLNAEAKVIETSITDLEKAKPEERTLDILGIAATSARKLEGKVHLKSLATQMASIAATTPASSPSGAAGQKPMPASASVQAPNDFSLEGTADDAGIIATLIEVLRDTGVFSRVDLSATSEAAGSSSGARQFRIECKF